MTKRQIAYWVIPPEADGEFVAQGNRILNAVKTGENVFQDVGIPAATPGVPEFRLKGRVLENPFVIVAVNSRSIELHNLLAWWL